MERGSQERSEDPLNQRVEGGKIVSRGPGRKVVRICLANRSWAAVLFAENGTRTGLEEETDTSAMAESIEQIAVLCRIRGYK